MKLEFSDLREHAKAGLHVFLITKLAVSVKLISLKGELWSKTIALIKIC